MRKPKACPKCGSKKIAEILYGLPAYTPDLIQDLETGKVVLGGCVITGKDPKWECVECGAQFVAKK